jgi:hypothetical protein
VKIIDAPNKPRHVFFLMCKMTIKINR